MCTDMRAHDINKMNKIKAKHFYIEMHLGLGI